MTLVSANNNLGATAIEQVTASRRMHVASTGQLIALLQDASGDLTYSTSAAGGASWSAPASLMGTSGNHYGAILYLSDVLYVFYARGGSGYMSKATFNTGTNTFGSVTTYPIQNPSNATIVQVDACWDTAKSLFYVATSYTGITGSPGTNAGMSTFPFSASGAFYGIRVDWGGGATIRLLGMVCLPATASTILLLYQTNTPGTLQVGVQTYSGGLALSGANSEVISALGSVPAAACALDNTGLLDVVAVDASNKLQATKRTGSRIFSVPVNPASAVNPSYPALSLATDGTGGLYCFFSSSANQSNGEIYFVQRLAGSWATPGFFAGGDASGYELPRSAVSLNGSHSDVLFQKGTVAPFSVYYSALPTGSTPNTPVWLEPSGSETSLTPTARFRYSNPNSLDPQGKVEYRYKESVTIIAESGAITTDATSNVYGVGWNASDPNYVAPATLVIGHTYTGEVRTQDAILGLWSGWSTPVSFTPVRGGTVTITSLSDNSIVSGSTPATIDSPNFDSITASWLQGDGHASDAYRDTIWNSGQTAIIQQTAATTIAGDLASGASFTSGSWNAANLQNGTTYLLIRSYRDKVTQLWSDSSPWTIHTAWTPPAPVTGLTATPNDDEGTVALAWTAGGGSGIDVAMSPHDQNAWLTLPSIGASVHETVYPCPFQSMDYRIRTVNALGIYSVDTIVTATMGARASNRYAIWITSLTLPTTLSVALGGKDSSNATTGLKWDNEDDAVETVYHGNRYPTTDWGLTDFKTVDIDFDIPPIYALKSGGYGTALADVAELEEMWRRREPVLYRDMDGVQRICEMHKWETERDRVGRYTVRFTLRECQAFVTPLVSP